LILGDGANLLVADAGVGNLVVSLAQGEFTRTDFAAGQLADGRVGVFVGAGAKLPQVITSAHRAGLTGLELLGGIPASMGGALVMNAGGAFGELGTFVHAVHALTRGGRAVTIARDEITFSYRRTDLGPRAAGGLIVTGVTLALTRAPSPEAVERARAKLIEVMGYKKDSQPMAAASAGCAFKNPTLDRAVAGVGEAGQRVSAGLLIDRAGCKGLTLGCASVSTRHANFITADPSHPRPCAADVIALMRQARQRVQDASGVTLEPEVVIWGERL
jgi:UDP-N-acetylmuramate dehydrogenase